MPKKNKDKKIKIVSKDKKVKKEEANNKPKVTVPQLVRGMKDILPIDQPSWDWLLDTVRSLARAYGYGYIETPIVEESKMFARSLGTTSDIVQKEMFSFTDTSGQEVTLRPEATASVVRAYIEHGMISLPQPVKTFYYGPMFRHERPQAGRQRQFHQAGLEVLGDAKPVVDAEIIFLAQSFFRTLGLPVTVQINSLGCLPDREEYRKKLLEYLKPARRNLCEDCRERLVKNPLRVLDCKQEGCRRIVAHGPQMVDSLCEADRDHFMKVLEYLDEMEVPYNLNHSIVRGLDYYTRTIFEFWPELDKEGEMKAQDALAAGGRYDGLAEILGGRPTHGCGVAIGLERVVQYLRHMQVTPPVAFAPNIFFAQLGEAARRKAFKIFEQLRQAGLAVNAAFTKDGLKQQLEIANRLRVRYTIILGQKEVLDSTLIIRDMENGVQEVVDAAKIVSELQKRLGKEPIVHVVGTPAVGGVGDKTKRSRHHQSQDDGLGGDDALDGVDSVEVAVEEEDPSIKNINEEESVEEDIDKMSDL